MEAIEHNIVIETGITVLIRMLGIPTWLRIQYIYTIPYKVDGLSVGHTVLVDEVCRGVVDDFIMCHKTCYLRTENLCMVPVGGIQTRTNATEDGFWRTWHRPTLFGGIEDVWIASLGILIFLVVIDTDIFEFSQFVTDSSSIYHLKCLAKCFSSFLTIFHIIIVCLTIGTGT